jgi:hypothetical protein
MLDRVVLSCQQNGVNTFYKCIEFQVNSFDSYWEILLQKGDPPLPTYNPLPQIFIFLFFSFISYALK